MKKYLKTLVGAATLAATAAACGSTPSAPTSGAVTSTPKSSAPKSSAPKSSAPARRFATPPAAVGLVAAVGPTSIQVQSSTAGEVTVDWSPTTRFQVTTLESPSALAIGTCVSAVVASGAARSVTAIGAPGATCTPPKLRLRRPGAFGGGGSAFSFVVGTVTGVSSTSLSIKEVSPSSVAATIALASTTRVATSVAGSASNLASGDCVVVRGATNSIGVVAASSIAVSPSVNGTCAQGARRFGGGGGFGGGGSGALGA